MTLTEPTETVAGAAQAVPRPLLMDAAQAAECLGLSESRVESDAKAGAL